MKLDFESCDELRAGRHGVDASGWIGQASEAVVVWRVKVGGLPGLKIQTSGTRIRRDWVRGIPPISQRTRIGWGTQCL